MQYPPWFCKTASLLLHKSPGFCHENALCVAGCYRRNIAANLPMSKSWRICIMCVKAFYTKYLDTHNAKSPRF